MSSCSIAVVLDELLDQLPDTTDNPLAVTDGDDRDLLEALASVPDPRRRRGVRHRFAPLLTATVAAMLAGARSIAAIAEWVSDLSPAARARLALDGPPPAGSTLWRMLVAVDADALQSALGSWARCRLQASAHSSTPASARSSARPHRGRRRVLAVDGKAMRATLHGDDPVHLLAALDHATGVVVAQVDVDAKTNEIPCFTTVLDQIEDLNGTVVTADAMHAQTAHAHYLHQRGAHLLVCVKGNQPTLQKRLRSIPWKDVPTGHTSTDRAHGRIAKRSLKAVTVPAGLGFPHAAQAIQITRKTRRTHPKPGRKHRWRTETVYAICTLPAEHATPAELATWIRQHWHIENKLHWVRDVTLGEDLHQARTRNGPHVLAILRNLVINLLRLTGHSHIAQALRHNARHPDQAITLLTSPFTTSQ
jgi:predicted transposase YbfD/YdcC